MTAVLCVSADEEIRQHSVLDSATISIGLKCLGRKDAAFQRNLLPNKNSRRQPRVEGYPIMQKCRGEFRTDHRIDHDRSSSRSPLKFRSGPRLPKRIVGNQIKQHICIDKNGHLFFRFRFA